MLHCCDSWQGCLERSCTIELPPLPHFLSRALSWLKCVSPFSFSVSPLIHSLCIFLSFPLPLFLSPTALLPVFGHMQAMHHLLDSELSMDSTIQAWSVFALSLSLLLPSISVTMVLAWGKAKIKASLCHSTQKCRVSKLPKTMFLSFLFCLPVSPAGGVCQLWQSIRGRGCEECLERKCHALLTLRSRTGWFRHRFRWCLVCLCSYMHPKSNTVFIPRAFIFT